MSGKTLRCAIYTRKSSEEGLDQSFNSLDAQREASEAYVLSQASEGWTLTPTHYDDGGYSGGTMERPGLQKLLADIGAGRVDIVVVYKIDRLTRSLADFARIVEIFEKADCSFVSVTQSFNTTNSMGRLMLNVLLSFAQFEREVTGERIRDKIAASKAKGMWMGGNLPLGYDLPEAGTRTLQVNQAEAGTVRHIFARYLELGSVHALQRELAEQVIQSKRWQTAKGKTVGGATFSRGALFHLLRNRIYLGQIVHKGKAFDGEHIAIVDPDIFDRVQHRLDANARRHRGASDRRIAKAPLTGKLFDAAGEPMSPTFSRGKSGRAYRYYVSASLQQGARSDDDGIRRLPAPAIERVITEAIGRWTPSEKKPFHPVRSVRLADDGLLIELAGIRPADLTARLADDERMLAHAGSTATTHLPVALPLRGGRRLVLASGKRTARPDPVLIAALRKAHAMLDCERGMPVIQAAPKSPYDCAILRLAFLSPDIQRDIMRGLQPPTLNLETLRHMIIPLAWGEQRKALVWDPANTPCSGD
ncbi:recombinase family protein [Parasphingopyxis marina]|uniref:Recombinase family protein n=1 Tax=Parasphingopyxis marina TaxID=2761622 RepID=A0A842I2Z9_9SPHN|nr:recombinase family protein [Parasphingopyxis marina]MBC2779179.1 recombinase family protein [Parasphingopyxis marina]